MSVGRRDFVIGALGAATGAKALLGCGDDGDDGSNGGKVVTPDKLALNATLFAHGVASGDPTPNGVILWSCVSTGGADPLEVEWAICSDPALQQILQRGTVTAGAGSGFTVKVDVGLLTPGTTYYYVFFAGDRGRSTIGRTRTLPATLDHARLAFTSCANYQNGYFNAYRAIAQRSDLDVWVHLGDYIYEYKAGEYADPNLAMRAHVPAEETVSLAQYRARYASYRGDPDLQEIHRQHPLIVVWDDHEFANNAWTGGAENHMPETEGDWTARKRAASQAFLEWLPIRVAAAEPVPKIFRTFKFGDLFDLIMLDTRMIARDLQAGNDVATTTPGGTGVGDPAIWRDPNRHIIGTEQHSWMLNELTQSQMRGARWRLIGNQVIVSQVRDAQMPVASDGTSRNILFADFWDGYQAERDGVLSSLKTQGIHNVVFLTGDIHSSGAFDVSDNPYDAAIYDPANGKNGIAVELVGPSITSQALEGDPRADFAPTLLKGANPHLKYAEFTRKGYVLIDLTQERLQAEWWFVRQYKMQGDASEELAIAFTCQQSSARLIETSGASAGKPAPAPAPA